MKAKKRQDYSATRRPTTKPGRNFLLRSIALVIPFLALLALELLLRLFSYGYPSSFFLKSRIAGRDVFIENSQFARRFFPPGLARSPTTLSLSAIKEPGTLRIFVLGESAAMGDPEPAFGFPRILEVLLRDALPGCKVEVINAAVTAINTHVIRDIAQDCAEKQGDWWIVYMGNNEVVGPFGAGTVFGNQTPSLGLIRASLVAKSTRLGQLLDAFKRQLAPGKPQSWKGMEMFLTQQVAEDDPRMTRVYQNFEQNLSEIINLGRQSGAQVVVSTVASNLKDCPPFASASPATKTNGDLAAWEQGVTSGSEAMKTGNFAEALKLFQRTTRYFSNSANVFFYIGRCQNGLGQSAEARRNFERARDLDTLRFRADTRINQLIRRAATNDPALQFLDGAELMARHSTNAIAGEEFLYEHVHFNFAGNYLLARAFASQILGPTNTLSLLPADECARRLAYTDYERVRVLEEMLVRVERPPFVTQFDAPARATRWRAQAGQFQALQRLDTFEPTTAIYRDAIARAPADWVLRKIFARYLETANDFKAAEEQWRKLIELAPQDAAAYYGLANTLDSLGRSAEAIPIFREALRRRTDFIEARNGLGLALANQGEAKAAVEQFESALRTKPDFVDARVNLGQTFAQQGRLEDAIVQYNEALRANSNHLAAHINLGKLLAGQGKNTEAVAQYRAALRVKPDHVFAHFNLAIALSALNDAESTEHYAAAAKYDPNFSDAHYNLALALARQGRNVDALPHFADAARLKPYFADGRLNHGVALAKAGRFSDAVREFQETLRLDPANDRARQFLAQAQARLPQ